MKKTKSLPKLKNDLQLIFNQFIRERDKDQPCISCGIVKPYKQAGHYFPVKGYDGLRFNEFNVNGECPGCNNFDDSHLIHYGDNLRAKIGEDNYQYLKAMASNYKQGGWKWQRADLIEMIAEYKRKLSET
jgi:5-methylcytosine-specific restriction endonuclease McrA